MGVDRVTPLLRPLRTLYFAAGSAADAAIAPFAALLLPRRRVSRETLLAAGLPPRGAFRRDAARVRLLRRQRRLRLRLRRLGPADLRGALEVRGEEGLRAAVAKGRGVIVLMTHGGPPLGIAAALKRLTIDALEVRTTEAPPAWDPPLRTVRFDRREPPLARSRALLVCREELRRGGVVAVAFEGPAGRRDRAAPRDGSPVRVAGGAAALARWSGAAVLPAWARVRAHGVLSVTFGDPLPLPDPRALDAAAFDAETAAHANAAFERLLADAPALAFERLVWARRIAHWQRAPRDPAAQPAPAPAAHAGLAARVP